MGDLIDYNNILTGDEADFLFTEPGSLHADDGDGDLFSLIEEKKEENNSTEDVELEDSTPEIVGDDSNKNQNGDGAQNQTQNPSPRFYASIAKALADEGVFSDFDISEDDINNLKTAQDFVELHRKWSESIRSADDKRILEATQAGVELNRIKQYEQTLRQLDGFTEDIIKAENDQSNAVRKQIIYQDYINRGFNQERALKATERSFTAGTDIEDAMESLASVKEYFASAYNDEIKESKTQQEQRLNQIKKESEQLKKDLLESEEPIKGIKVDKVMRQKAFDALTKPVTKDDAGNNLTAIQKFEKENPLQFRKALGVLYAITDGFKDVNKVIKHQAKAEARKGMTELEKTLLNSGSRITDGSFQLAGAGGYEEFNMNEGLILA